MLVGFTLLWSTHQADSAQLFEMSRTLGRLDGSVERLDSTITGVDQRLDGLDVRLARRTG